MRVSVLRRLGFRWRFLAIISTSFCTILIAKWGLTRCDSECTTVRLRAPIIWGHHLDPERCKGSTVHCHLSRSSVQLYRRAPLSFSRRDAAAGGVPAGGVGGRRGECRLESDDGWLYKAAAVAAGSRQHYLHLIVEQFGCSSAVEEVPDKTGVWRRQICHTSAFVRSPNQPPIRRRNPGCC